MSGGKRNKCVAINLYITIVCICFLSTPCLAQVTNNRIQNRVPLKLDEGWYLSHTENSNVEWDCINRALTNKCLVYHNDQWFTITPSSTGPYFLNVSQQRCRKMYGVQMVVIEGDPCKATSYRIKKCIPFADQSDFYVKLDSLNSNQEYLINIDGYLGDHCEFKIAFSSFFNGLPIQAQNQNISALVLTQRDSVIWLRWSIPDSLLFDTKEFHVYRKMKNEKSAVKISLPLIANAYGAKGKNFELTDTLSHIGEYTYKVYGVTASEMLFLAEEKLKYSSNGSDQQFLKPTRIKSYKKHIDYFLKRKGSVKIEVLDGASQKRLFSTYKQSMQGRNIVTLDLQPFVSEGITFFTIIIRNKDFQEEFTVRFSE